MKCHIGVNDDSGLVHSAVGTAVNVNDITQAYALMHGQESDVFTDSGYQGVDKREDTRHIRARWNVAMKTCKRRTLYKSNPMGDLLNRLEKTKAAIRAKVEHPFRVIRANLEPATTPLIPTACQMVKRSQARQSDLTSQTCSQAVPIPLVDPIPWLAITLICPPA